MVIKVTVSNRLGLGFTFDDLNHRDGLIRLDKQFLDVLSAQDADLHQRLLTARATPETVTGRAESDLVVALGPHLDGFVTDLFQIQAETAALREQTLALDPVHACKRLFVQRQAVKKYADPSGFDADGTAYRAGSQNRIAPLTEQVLSPCSVAGVGGQTRTRWTKRCATPLGPP